VSLSDAELARYARQLILPGFNATSQEFLRATRVHVVGAGELAGPALIYLAQAGVGTLFLDEALDVAPEDTASWLYRADQVGEPRLFTAMAALREQAPWARVRPYATGADPTAVLVCAPSLGLAREAAERARLAGLPHVVTLADGDGGEVVTVPVGAPCYACASRPGTGALPRPGVAAALGALGAMELLLVITGLVPARTGRRIDLVLGQPQARATARLPGCECGQGRGI
jgi:molybdopterin-synthase adenylyltransferase